MRATLEQATAPTDTPVSSAVSVVGYDVGAGGSAHPIPAPSVEPWWLGGDGRDPGADANRT